MNKYKYIIVMGICLLSHLCQSKELNDMTIRNFLKNEATHMHTDVINKVISVLHCQKHVTPKLAVIDYSLPSDQKRLWIIDLKNRKILYYTHVAHGLYSGSKMTRFFSNSNDSKQSSLGVYETLYSYKGREGTSLKLHGLDDGLNDNAQPRAIVMHGSDYVEESFIHKYGQAGRSWGCPAIPASQAKEMINSIADHQLLIAYYPGEQWFLKSKYLNCYSYTLRPAKHVLVRDVKRPSEYQEYRSPVLFATNIKVPFHSENSPLLAIKARDYKNIFSQLPPMNRMIRRSIQHEEYIAIDDQELLDIHKHHQYQLLKFLVPRTTSYNGHTKTMMQIVDTGNIINYQPKLHLLSTTLFNIQLTPHQKFIRWIGL